MNRWIPIAAMVTLSLSPLVAQNPDEETLSLEEVIANLDPSQSQSQDRAPAPVDEPAKVGDNAFHKGRSNSQAKKHAADALGAWTEVAAQNPFQWKDVNGDPVNFGWVNPATGEILQRFWNQNGQSAFESTFDFYQPGSSTRSLAVSSGADGSLRVKVNGKRVEDSRLRHKDGEVEVLGEDGEVLFRFKHNADGAAEIPKGANGFFTFHEPTPQWNSERPLIGINMEPVPEPLAYHLDLEANSGIMITGVVDGYSAKRSGVKKYDIVVGINGEGDVTMQSLREAVAANAGKSIRLAVLRQGQRMVIEVPVELRKTAAANDPGLGTIRWIDPHLADPRLDADGIIRWRPIISSDGSLVMDPLVGAESNAWRAIPGKDGTVIVDPQRATSEENSPTTLERLEKRLDRLEKLIERLDKKF